MNILIKVSEDLQNRLLFDSDGTCCLCQVSGYPVFLYPIDSVSTNLKYENLAVVCENCRNRVNGDFKRKFAPELFRLLNENWKARVRENRFPGVTSSSGMYLQTVLREIAGLPHDWKNEFFFYSPEHLEDRPHKTYADVWDLLIDLEFPWSEQIWEKYHPLFNEYTPIWIDRIERFVMMHGAAIPPPLRVAIMNTIGKMKMERVVFLATPSINARHGVKDFGLTHRFKSVFESLRSLNQVAEATFKSLMREPPPE